MADAILRRNYPKSIQALKLREDQWVLFWAKVDRRGEGDCWLWRGAKHSLGYGVWRAGGRTLKAHRVAWFLENGRDVPRGKTIDHKCMVKLCCNPGHLEPVTQSENTLRYVMSRQAGEPPNPFCKHGHALEGENLYVARSGVRVCKTCRDERVRAWQAANPERRQQHQREYEERRRYRRVVAAMVARAQA